MPLNYRCNKCGRTLTVGKACDCTKRLKYAQYHSDSFYQTKEWEKIKPIVIARFNGLDIYSYYKLHIIEHGFTVHHIIPIDEDPNQRLSIDNLIYLTESNHRLLHAKMKKSAEAKAAVQAELKKLIDIWNAERRGDGYP